MAENRHPERVEHGAGTNPDELCDCMCAFDLCAWIDGLAKGVEYTVQLLDDGRSTLIAEETVVNE